MTQEWPIVFKDNLIPGNLDSSVGIATLWTPKDAFRKRINSDLYCVMGQLYSNDGINPILRNVLARPQIKTIVLCGQDKIGSADALAKLVENGIDENHRVIGKQEARVEKEIPSEAVDRFRANVNIVDIRGEFHPDKVQDVVRQHQAPNEAWAKPETFPEAEFSASEYPIDPHGFKVREKTVAHAWLRILNAVLRFGNEKETHHGTKQKELLNFMTVVTEEDPENIHWAEWFNFTKEHFEGYKPQVMSSEPIESLEYTYGSRLRDHDGVDQITTIIQKIKDDYFTRRAVAVTWNVAKDNLSDHPPCLDLVQANVQRDKLHLTAFIRSNDMFRAWPENALALRTMQKEIADGVGIEMGEMCTISQAHIYEESYVEAQEIIDTYYEQEVDFCRFDTRGNFTIDLNRENGVIEMTMMSPGGEKIGQFKDTTAVGLLHQLVPAEAVSEVGHAMDVGLELFKAETCLRTGIHYHQDINGTAQFYKAIERLL